MEVIVPAAGLSSRFMDMKPKYLLYGYDSRLMIQNALKGYDKVHIGILKEHDEKFEASAFLRHELGDNIDIIIIDKVTQGPADTVAHIIKKSNIDKNSSILIKDCDSFFDHDITDGNYVCVSSIAEHFILKRVAQKSFVVSNNQGIITDIVEKSVISDTFCVGGYKFNSAELYLKMFESIKSEREIFVSDVVQKCLQSNIIFSEKRVTNYIDVGTSDEWFDYNKKPAIFCDIDGTIIKNQTRVGSNSYHSPATPLPNTVKHLLLYQKKGAQFIFTTSRPESLEGVTRQILDSLGFVNYKLVMGIHNATRIIVNDYNNNNPYPRAVAVNVYRDSDELNRVM